MTSSLKANDARILDIQSVKTPAGITVWHIEDHTLPIITMNFAFKGAGAVTDPANHIGLGQIVSNTLDEGAGERTGHEFQTALQDHAIDLSFGNGRDHFTGKIKTLTKHKNLTEELLRDALMAPRFDDEAITRMKNANLMRLKSSLASTDWLAARLMNDVYFGGHTYARNSGGTLSGIASITKEAMENFTQNYLTRDRLFVSVAGDMTQDEAADFVDKIFSNLPSGSPQNSVDNVSPPTAPVKKAFKTESPQSSVQMVWPIFPKTDPDYYALRVLNHLLGAGGFSSALMEEVREKRGLTYGIYSRPIHMNFSNYMSIESATSPENIAPMMAAITDVLNEFKTEHVSDDKLTAARNYLVGSLPLRFSTTQSLSRTAMSMGLNDMGIDYLDLWDDEILKVTAADVKRVAERIFISTTPTAMVIAGAVPDDLGFEIIETMPGVE